MTTATRMTTTNHGEAMPYSIDEQIAAVKREIALRKQVYKRQVESGRLSEGKADYEIGAMEAVLATLEEVARRKPEEFALKG
jgi:cytochrome c556